ncbi:hypothetical protein HK101_005728, partial [Irineochytrium annulatum]
MADTVADTVASTTATVSVGAVVAASVIAGACALYAWFVPSDHVALGDLSNLVHAKGLKEDPFYPESYWPGSRYAQLTRGKVHYYLLGPPTGPKVVAIHGITAGWVAMPKFIENLAEAGFRVLIYDLYGRGYSAAPGVPYNEDLYVGQVKELLDKVEEVERGWGVNNAEADAARSASPRVNVLGYSLGGGIAAAFAARHPERVDKLTLIAPAGLMKVLPTGGRILTFPIIGKLIAHALGRQILIRLSASKHNPLLLDTPALKQFVGVTNLIALRHPGFMRAYLSTVGVGPIRNLHERYASIGRDERLSRRTLCLWGDADDTVSYKKEMPQFRELVKEAKMVTFPRIGHSLLVEEPDVCAKHVIDFLK